MKHNPIQEHFDNVRYFFIANSGTSDNEVKRDLFQFILQYNKLCKHLSIDNRRVISDEEVLQVMDTKIE